MSVLDLLPHSVSGVYFIYDREYEKWSFGKMSALREIAFAAEEGYGFYYMGYYIHGCAKMRYKNEYEPQFCLDLETFGWGRMDEGVLGRMEEGGYVSLSRDLRAKEKNEVAGGKELEMSNGLAENENGGGRRAFDTPSEASEAVEEGMSLFELDFPGMMTATQVEEEIDLDSVKLRVRGGRIVTSDVSILFPSRSSYGNSSG